MKNVLKIVLTLGLIAGSAFADNGENGTMDKLTNDSAFNNTTTLFNQATSDDSGSGEALLSAIVTIPAAAVESVIWVCVLPFNVIKTAVQD